MDWTILHALNNFLAQRDAVEDPLLTFVNLSELLFPPPVERADSG
jgi:hypothetical protein